MAGETTALQAWLDATRLRLDDLEVRVRALEARTATVTAAPSLGLDPVAFGARGDGVADDTAAVQRCVDACPVGGAVDGRGRTYVVRRVNLKSDVTFQDALLRSPGSTSDYASVVNLGDNYRTDVTRNVVLRRLRVDGNRNAHTNIGGGEDGGRHGFRLVGRVEDVLLEDCEAVNCASDGLCLYSGIYTTVGAPTAEPLLRRVTVRRGRFAGNRRLGGSGDSLGDCLFEDCVFEDNGRDTGTTGGGLGANPRGGFDLEGYGSINTLNRGVTFRRCVFRRSAVADQNFVGYWPVNTGQVGFMPCSNLRWESCTFDAGGGTTYCLQLTSAIEYKAGPAVYQGATFVDCTFRGRVLFRACRDVTITGGTFVTTASTVGLLDYARNVRAALSAVGTKRFEAYDSTVTYV